MATDLIEIPSSPDDRRYDGRAMSSLPPRQRQFVIAMLAQGARSKACEAAAAQCGYHRMYGWELMRHEGVLAALREEATKRLAGAALVGVNVMLEIATDATHKDRFKAAKELAAINGFTAEQRIVVEHISPDTKSQIAQIKQVASELGLDAKALIHQAGIIEDAEFTEVKVPDVDTSDW